VCKIPSIHFLYPLNPTQVHGGAGAYPSCQCDERQGTPWTRRQSIIGPHRDKRPFTLTLTQRVKLGSPINLTSIFFWTVGGRRSTRRETHTYTRRTCKLHTERLQPGFKPGTLLLGGGVLTTTPPLCKMPNWENLQGDKHFIRISLFQMVHLKVIFFI